jgi:hypothetical protein
MVHLGVSQMFAVVYVIPFGRNFKHNWTSNHESRNLAGTIQCMGAF